MLRPAPKIKSRQWRFLVVFVNPAARCHKKSQYRAEKIKKNLAVFLYLDFKLFFFVFCYLDQKDKLQKAAQYLFAQASVALTE